MPIYEYECPDCGNVTEALQKFSDKPLSRCKSCGGKLHKLISHSSFHLKGTGWYVTDYANKSRHSATCSNKKGVATETVTKKAESKTKKSKKNTDKTG